MASVFRLLHEVGWAGLVVEAISFSLLGIVLLIGFIVLRRWHRGQCFRRLNERTFALRSMWDDILAGHVPAATWRLKRFDCEIVESILLDSIEAASPERLPDLVRCLRNSGLLDMRIHEARALHGWKRRAALIALGRTRAPEAVPALAEALDAPPGDPPRGGPWLGAHRLDRGGDSPAGPCDYRGAFCSRARS